jgi:excisionase family DNA binding protein
MAIVSTKEAARRLGVSLRRVQAMIRQGIIPATKLTREWMIDTADLQRVKAMERKPGRPRKLK